jgi:hypothetical protein
MKYDSGAFRTVQKRFAETEIISVAQQIFCELGRGGEVGQAAKNRE